MATIHDLIEVTSIAPDTTYSMAAGNVVGVVDGVTSTALDDGEFDVGDQIVIGGVSYTINQIQEPLNSGRFTLEDGSNLSFDPGSESNLAVVFLTVSNCSDVRHFIVPNDSYGDMTIDEIRTGSLTAVAGSDAAVISTANNDVKVVCFVAGSLIDTASGPVPVERITVGDMVWTRDNGPQPVRAVLTREIDLRTAPERLKPVAFAPDALGPGRPDRQLCVSPQHRMLVTDAAGVAVLVPAKALLGRRGVRVMQGKRQVTYLHLVFTRHEIIRANGTLTESFYPGPVALDAVMPGSLREMREIFGEAGPGRTPPPVAPAGPILQVREARRMALTFQ